ncbi:hypothetical protein D7Z26_07875 [Cohnella endophytica]|uniref:Uncharacterized protein n=1 Tax=Cohnella endophytica TaxID=2419778 RepID=A0A494Y193_9BACL|nr:hypothetical protein D7Z26_07875 [Cohnella endophytica]
MNFRIDRIAKDTAPFLKNEHLFYINIIPNKCSRIKQKFLFFLPFLAMGTCFSTPEQTTHIGIHFLIEGTK